MKPASAALVLAAIILVGTDCARASGSQPTAVVTSPTPATSPSPATPPLPGQVLSAGYYARYDFVSPELGWALVAKLQDVFSLAPAPSPDFWVYRTADGAKSWQNQFSGTVAGFYIGGIQFFDRANGILDVNGWQKSTIYHTADGGEHWSVIPVPSNTMAYSFADPMHGWVTAWHDLNGSAAHPDLLSTADGGQTWNPRSWAPDAFWPGNGIVGEQHFRGNGEGWFGGLGLKAMAYSTPDGGTSWQTHAIAIAPGLFPTPSPDDPNFDVNLFLLPEAGVLAVVGGPFGWERAFTSFDGGATWKLISWPPDPMPFGNFLYVDAKHWWAIRADALFKTSDAGQTWKRVQAPMPLDGWIYSAHIIDSEHAWAELTEPTIAPGRSAVAMSSDGGVTWTPIDVPRPS